MLMSKQTIGGKMFPFPCTIFSTKLNNSYILIKKIFMNHNIKNKLRVFWEGAPEGSERSPSQPKGAPAHSHTYGFFIDLNQRAPNSSKGSLKKSRSAPPFFWKDSYDFSLKVILLHFRKYLSLFFFILKF